MENREQQILSEIRQMILSMRTQLDMLEDRLSQLGYSVDYEVVDDTPIDLDIDESFLMEDLSSNEDFPVEESVDSQSDEVVEEVVEEVIEDVLDEVVEEVVEEVIENALEDVVEESVEDKEVLIDVAVANAKPTVIDAMAAKQAWRTAIPGSQLKDVRGAISLNDRIIFINHLFDENPIYFQEVLTKINAMTSLDEVLEYLYAERPDWDYESDEVYRFMMAVRRRVRNN